MRWLDVTARLALVGVLAACATSLRAQLDTGRARLNTERVRTARSDRFVLTSSVGINLEGRLVFDSISPQTKRLVVCGLRGQTLRHDVEHWTAIEALLPDDSGVEIVAYCDGPACRTSLSQSTGKETFTVIAFGEATATHAVASADGEGDCLLLDRNLRLLRRIAWRTSGQEPAALAKEILR